MKRGVVTNNDNDVMQRSRSLCKSKAYLIREFLSKGLLRGVALFFGMAYLVPYIVGETKTEEEILIAIPVWLASGILFEYMVLKLTQNKNRRNNDISGSTHNAECSRRIIKP